MYTIDNYAIGRKQIDILKECPACGSSQIHTFFAQYETYYKCSHCQSMYLHVSGWLYPYHGTVATTGIFSSTLVRK